MEQNQPMKVLTSHESVEWLTPPFYIDLVRKVLGKIDLDPASHPISQRWIKADFTMMGPPGIDGLEHRWWGKVFCNPPYGKTPAGVSNQALWSMKMHKEYKEGRMTE